MSMVINSVCSKKLSEQLGLHRYAVSTYPDELVLEAPPKKILCLCIPILVFAYGNYCCV